MRSTTWSVPVRLGNGSYGEVYEKRGKAVKITDIASGSFDVLQSCVRELHTFLQMSSSPYIVPLYDAYYEAGEFALHMQLADDDMHEIMRNYDVSSERLNEWFVQLIKGMHEMHKKQIFHRDVKPPNILVKGPRAMYCDFGLSRQAMNNVEALNGTGYIVTRWYRSPELLEHQIKTKDDPIIYTANMDIWSLGVILFEMIFQKHFSNGKTNEKTLEKIGYRLNHFPDKPATVSDATYECMKGMLMRDPAERFTTAKCLRTLKVMSAEKYIEEIEHPTTTMNFAPDHPEPDEYDHETWIYRRKVFFKAYKDYPTLKSIIAYAILLFDRDDESDLSKRYHISMLYSGLVYGSYYHDDVCKSMIDKCANIFGKNEAFRRLSSKMVEVHRKKLREVSLWEKKEVKSFRMYLDSVLYTPEKHNKIKKLKQF